MTMSTTNTYLDRGRIRGIFFIFTTLGSIEIVREGHGVQNIASSTERALKRKSFGSRARSNNKHVGECKAYRGRGVEVKV